MEKIIRITLLFRYLEVLRNANNEILLDVTKNSGAFAKKRAQTFNNLPIIIRFDVELSSCKV